MLKKRSDKRIKVKRVVVRVKDEVFEAFTKYANNKGTTKTAIIDTFLEDLLKDELKDMKK